MTYRDDIDGLRALAVLLILFFHAGLASTPGGFVGVDVFFVISGFLITTLVRREIAEDRFHYADFYLRRLRRLAPALIATIFLTLIAGWFLFPPTVYEDSAAASIATIFSVSNIYFWWNTGYFDSSAAYKPLLHTWSLGVEEQFYLIWPALLVVSVRYLSPGRLIVLLVAISVASLIAAEILLPTHTNAAFFLTPFRTYEFSAGAILALTGLQARNTLLANAAGLAGIVIIWLTATRFTDEMPFPGVLALIPTLATALVIYAGPHTIANRMLAAAPIRYIGQISYSLYLVHWPVAVFYRFLFDRPETSLEILGVLAISVLLGAVMYHLVETPFRSKMNGTFRISAKTLMRLAGGTTTAALLLSLGITLRGGVPERFNPQITSFLAELQQTKDQQVILKREHTCNASEFSADAYFAMFDSCLPTDRTGMIVVLGDSHAGGVYVGLRENHPDLSVVQLTGNGCDIAKTLDGNSFCAPFLRHWADWIEANKANIAAIIYQFDARSLVNRGYGGVPQLHARRIELMTRNLPLFQPEGVPFFIWGPRPELRPGIDLAIIRSRDGHELRHLHDTADVEADLQLDAFLATYAAGNGLNYTSTAQVLCTPHCPVLTDDDRLYVLDHAHWTPRGAARAVSVLVEATPALAAIISELDAANR